MKLRDALVLGAVQGLAEFLPISSSAHLLLVRQLLAHADAPLAYDVALHLATTGALITAAGPELAVPASALLRDLRRHRLAPGRYSPDARLAVRVAAANLPAVAAGALLHDRIQAGARGSRRVALTLALGSLALAAAGRLERSECSRTARELTTVEALAVGAAQAAALLPGVSRSGAAIAAGLALGLTRTEAVRFSFLLSAPITLAAGVRTLPSLPAVVRQTGWRSFLTGGVTAYLTGLAGIAVLRRTLPRIGMRPFLVYRLGLAAVVALLTRWPLRQPRRD